MLSLNMPVQRLKVVILPLDLPCSGPVTNSGEILTTGKSHGFFFNVHNFCQGPNIVIARPGRPKPSYATDNRSIMNGGKANQLKIKGSQVIASNRCANPGFAWEC